MESWRLQLKLGFYHGEGEEEAFQGDAETVM